MNDCGDCGKSNASVVYPPRQTRIYSRLFYTPVFYTPLYMLYTPLCMLCTVYSVHPCTYALYTLVYALYTVVYALPTPSLHQTYTAVYLLCHSVHKLRFVECKHVFSVFVCISCVARGQPTIVSQSLQIKCFLCDLLYVAHTLGRVGLTLIGEYFEPPRSLLGISIRSDAI